MSLILHAGAKALDRGALAALPLPAKLGPRHAIRPFIEDVELVTEYLSDVGLLVKEEAFGVKYDEKRSPQQFFGLLEVAPRVLEGEYIPADFALNIGLRGSYDQSLKRALAVGSRVFVCDNLAFSGEINVATKQTTFVADRLPRMLRDAVAQVPVLAKLQTQRFDAYRNKELKPRAGDAALIECVRRGILNPSQVGKAIAEWDAPSHAEHAEQGYSVWRIQQAVTEAIKPAPDSGRPDILPAWERTTKLTRFLDEVTGLKLAA